MMPQSCLPTWLPWAITSLFKRSTQAFERPRFVRGLYCYSDWIAIRSDVGLMRSGSDGATPAMATHGFSAHPAPAAHSFQRGCATWNMATWTAPIAGNAQETHPRPRQNGVVESKGVLFGGTTRMCPDVTHSPVNQSASTQLVIDNLRIAPNVF